ncbi:PREDICTED: scarecrow-like protein 29 [Tarenaya hassleriana]|uniref:scarecrow-like protein 29 n=1 Tax=Tarenaya hassleriana TaxID=28532 RepID=UPI00053C9976|nr:PREDICTED: scarecrow-like protein 29 [Tarenaya hassleriana]
MSLEESEPPSQNLDHILGWLEGSVSFTPFSGLDDPYFPHGFNGSQSWEWDQTQDFGHDLIHNLTQDPSNNEEFMNDGTTDPVTGAPVIVPDPPPEPPQPSDQSRKRNSDALVDVRAVKRPARRRRNINKSAGKSCNDGDKSERWAEQLLNPCAVAIMTGNSSRVQHYLCVIRELASSSGDPNYRLAAAGLRALTHHLSSSSSSSMSTWPALTFPSAEVKMFQQTLLKFYEVSPWFAFPNNMANSAILQILAQESRDKRDLHILDIGVSHGMQWPTLLEALSRRPEGPPPRIQITVISDQSKELPFSVGPPAYNYSSQLLTFAQSLNINLQINVLDNFPLQNLCFQVIDIAPHETLVICAQFRLHQLKHNSPDERSEILKVLRSFGPKGVILSENNAECSCSSCGDFATRYSKKLEYLWKFLDSTNSGFKGQDSEERKLMEGEATKALTSEREMNEGKEKWFDRMRRAGFATEVFGEDAIDGARALLRKYDNNWEIRLEDEDTFAGLWWKGESVSFCSLWK